MTKFSITRLKSPSMIALIAAIALVIIAAVLVVVAVSGGFGRAESSATNADTALETPEQTVEPKPKFVEGGTAFENEAYFSWSLRKAIREGMPVNGVEVVNVLAAAGFDKAAMQVSFDKTKTNLTADSVFVSVRVNDQCLLGQVVSDDKTVAVDVQPVVGPNKDICLIGKTRPIDW